MTTTVDRQPGARQAPARDLIGIVVVALPVTDLARSAAWYRDLLDLDYVREFGDGSHVTGCALADFDRPLHDRASIALHHPGPRRPARRAPDHPRGP